MSWAFGLTQSCQCATKYHTSLRACFYHLRHLQSVHCPLGRDVFAQLVSNFVLQRPDHGNAALAGLPASTLAPLQRILHATVRLVLDIKPCNHVTPVRRELHRLRVNMCDESSTNCACSSTRLSSVIRRVTLSTYLRRSPTYHRLSHCATPPKLVTSYLEPSAELESVRFL